MTVSIGIPKREAQTIELACDDERARKLIRALAAFYPYPVQALKLMKAIGIHGRAPERFIKFCILKTNTNGKIKAYGWQISQNGGLETDELRLERIGVPA